jgi:hypothetical protein
VLLRDWEVRAILERRLTMLARPVRASKGCTLHVYPDDGDGPEPVNVPAGRGSLTDVICPFGIEGDVLIGKEAWFEVYSHDTARPLDPPKACYRSTETDEVIKLGEDGCTAVNRDGTFASPWRPAQHMPPWAVRIRLRVVSVACKRVQEATDEVAAAQAPGKAWGGGCYHRSWAGLWDADNPRHPWASNPWAWLARVERAL